MRRLIGLASLVFVGVLAWNIVNQLSADAIGMAVGLAFGTLAGIPAAALVFAGSGRYQRDDYDQGFEAGRREARLEELQRDAQRLAAPTVIVVNPTAQYTPARPFALVDGEVTR